MYRLNGAIFVNINETTIKGVSASILGALNDAQIASHIRVFQSGADFIQMSFSNGNSLIGIMRKNLFLLGIVKLRAACPVEPERIAWHETFGEDNKFGLLALSRFDGLNNFGQSCIAAEPSG